METVMLAVISAMLVALGFALGLAWKSDTVGQLKHENERLNSELKRLTDRDSRGRFKK
jgi:Tfp pilus assembly protein PilO